MAFPALDLEQMVGQMLFLDLFGEAELELLKRYRLGGVMVRRRHARSTRQLVRIISRHQSEAVLPLLVAAHFEYGAGGDTPAGTLFPGPLTIGASSKEAVAREYARVSAMEALLLGVNHVMMPVLDISSQPAVLGLAVRSFGESPETVARLGVEIVRTFQKHRIIATAKHFPGAGSAEANSLDALPVVGHDISRLRKVELLPFRRAIKAGVRCIMVSHLHLPALVANEARPASLSEQIVSGLLRNELGYRGLVITENLAHPAIVRRLEPIQACLDAIRAGCDMLLTKQEVLKPTMFQDLVRAVERDPALVQRAEQASRRILEAKHWLGLFSRRPGAAEEAVELVGADACQRAAHRVALAGTVLYRNHNGRLPLKPAKKESVLVVTPRLPESPFIAIKDNWGQLYRRLRELHPETRPVYVAHSPTRSEIQKTVRNAERADYVVAIMAHEAGHAVDGRQAALVDAILKVKPAAVIAVLGNPFAVKTLATDAAAVVLTFSNMPASQAACAEVIMGKAKPGGRLPVAL